MGDLPGKTNFVNADDKNILTVDPDAGFVQVVMKTPGGDQIMQITNTGSLSLWGAGDDHDARLDGSIGTLILGGHNRNGKALLRDDNKQDTIVLDASDASVAVGRSGREGDIAVRDEKGNDAFRVDGNSAAVYVGAVDNEGDVIVRDAKGRDVLLANGGDASVTVGANDNPGRVTLRDAAGQNAVELKASNAALYIGVADNEGDLIVRDAKGREVLRFDGASATLQVGTAQHAGRVAVRDEAGNETVVLDGTAGDIVLTNADCAEEFEVERAAEVDPGTVVVINPEGRLEGSERAYDTRVAGVVAGAGTARPGIVLGRVPGACNRLPIALTGRVFCKVDAGLGPVEVGNLLTTSSTPGHAMRVGEPSRAFGGVIGKALAPLGSGRGLIPVLVALQ